MTSDPGTNVGALWQTGVDTGGPGTRGQLLDPVASCCGCMAASVLSSGTVVSMSSTRK